MVVGYMWLALPPPSSHSDIFPVLTSNFVLRTLQHSRPIRHVTSLWHDGFSCHKNRVSDIIVFKLSAIKKSIKLFWTRRLSALKDDVSIQWLRCSKRAAVTQKLSTISEKRASHLSHASTEKHFFWSCSNNWYFEGKIMNDDPLKSSKMPWSIEWLVDGSSEEKWKICAWHVMKSKPLAGEGIINKCFFSVSKQWIKIVVLHAK